MHGSYNICKIGNVLIKLIRKLMFEVFQKVYFNALPEYFSIQMIQEVFSIFYLRVSSIYSIQILIQIKKMSCSIFFMSRMFLNPLVM